MVARANVCLVCFFLPNIRWTFMTISMFSSVFLIKSYNRTRKREYIASKIQEEGGT